MPLQTPPRGRWCCRLKRLENRPSAATDILSRDIPLRLSRGRVSDLASWGRGQRLCRASRTELEGRHAGRLPERSLASGLHAGLSQVGAFLACSIDYRTYSSGRGSKNFGEVMASMFGRIESARAFIACYHAHRHASLAACLSVRAKLVAISDFKRFLLLATIAHKI